MTTTPSINHQGAGSPNKASGEVVHVYRVQDLDGRGPYKPGVSMKWSSDCGPILPTIHQDFGPDIATAFMPGWHYGCAFRTLEQVRAWFSIPEVVRLADLGYHLVSMRAEPVRESAHQLIIRRKLPLRRKVNVVPWAAVYSARVA